MIFTESFHQHYNAGNETNRLKEASLERLRTESILRRYLPKAPGIILDVGGADETLVGASGHFAVVAYK